MQILQLFSPSLIFINQALSSKAEVFQFCAKKMMGGNFITDIPHIISGLYHREKEGTTVMMPLCAIPHVKSTHITYPILCVITLNKEIDWLNIDNNINEKVKNIILLAIPEEQKGDFHIDILKELSLLLSDDKQRKDIFNSTTPQEFIQKANNILERHTSKSFYY